MYIEFVYCHVYFLSKAMLTSHISHTMPNILYPLSRYSPISWLILSERSLRAWITFISASLGGTHSKSSKITKVHEIIYLMVHLYAWFRFGIWYLKPLSIIFQLYQNNQFYWWSKLEYPTKTTVTDKFYHIPYLGLHNAQDFAHILYYVGVVHIINRNNAFHSFPDRKITCPPCFFVNMQS